MGMYMASSELTLLLNHVWMILVNNAAKLVYPDSINALDDNSKWNITTDRKGGEITYHITFKITTQYPNFNVDNIPRGYKK